MSYQFGHFIWGEVHSADVEKSKAFYAAVLGWTASEMPMGQGSYTMLSSPDGKGQIGIVPAEGEAPPHFAQYLSVEDVDATVAEVEAAGGRALVAPLDSPVGRFAVVADPQGAAFAVMRAAESDDNSSTLLHWNELWSPEADEVIPFYEKVFGLSREEMQMPAGKYTILKHGETKMGGAMTSPLAGVPPMWLPYLQVDSVDDTIKRAEARGGKLLGPVQEVPGVGKFGIVKEPEGAVVGLITPAAA